MPFNDIKVKWISKNSSDKNLVFSWAGPEFKTVCTCVHARVCARAHRHTHTGHNLLLSPHAVFHQLDMRHELTEINEHIRVVICHFLSFPPIPLIFPAELPENFDPTISFALWTPQRPRQADHYYLQNDHESHTIPTLSNSGRLLLSTYLSDLGIF